MEIVAVIAANKLEALGALFLLSEILALSPLKSNSVFQLVSNAIKSAYQKVKG